MLCYTILLLASNAFCQTFDYVVVGGGTTGLPLAVRLAQYHTVALIEAGGYYELEYPLAKTPAADVLPVGSDPGIKKIPIDWGFITTPQQGANGRRVHFSRGRCLGGSSALNFMIYQRQTMERWADAVNDTSYSFDNIFPFYQRSANFTPPNTDKRFSNATALYNASAFTSDGGPLQVSYSNYAMPWSTWVARGMQGIGMTEAVDFNSGQLDGYQYCTSTIRPSDQTRSTSESSFLGISAPKNLKVYKKTLAKRILFDDDKNAIGVQVSPSRTLMASKEVIISAGVFQSPQLLMVSGIGPREHLQRHSISVLSDLPGVGQGMLDHPFFGPSYRVGVGTMTRPATDPLYLVEEYLRWAILHEGILSNPVADFIAFEKIPDELRLGFSKGTRQNLSYFPKDWPEVEYMSGAGFLGNISNMFKDQPKDGYEYTSILGVLHATTSQGTVTLASADTSDAPIINPNWLETESDQQLAVALFKRIRQVFANEEIQSIIIGEEYYPGESVRTDGEILKWIRNNVMTLWHPSRSCKMGTRNDTMAVVDSRARVFGVNRLRVVDSSAIPFLPPGHPQSTCCECILDFKATTNWPDMLAEKIADDILSTEDVQGQIWPDLR